MRGRLGEALKNRSIAFEENVETKRLCTFQIGGTCRYLITPACQNELIAAVILCQQLAVPYHVIGRGSNLLFGDGMLPLALIRTVGLNAIRIMGDEVIADCGAALPVLARKTAGCGYGDLTFAAGIPGTLGGGVLMNAGAHERSLGELVEWVKVLVPHSGKIKTYFHQELSFSYRKSDFQAKSEIILQACLRLREAAEPATVEAEMRQMLTRRAKTQPLDFPSAGSIFLRTDEGVSMGKIIDELGLKGTRRGNAMISQKHGGFIVNLGGATAADVCCLIDLVRGITQEKHGFVPKTEIKMITGKEET